MTVNEGSVHVPVEHEPIRLYLTFTAILCGLKKKKKKKKIRSKKYGANNLHL